MENIFIIAIVSTILFCLAKFLDMKYIGKESKPLKIIVRDAIIVFACSASAAFVFFNMNSSISEMLNIMTDTKTVPIGGIGATEIFTDSPGF